VRSVAGKRKRWRPCHPVSLIRLTLCVALAAAQPSTVAQAALPTAGIAATAVLGTVVSASLRLSNTSAEPATYLLFEALDAPSQVAAMQTNQQPLRVPLPDLPGPIAPDLHARFNSHPDAAAEMIIYLAQQADLSAAAGIGDWNKRGAAVVSALKAHAVRTQAPLLAELTARGERPRSFWVVNAIAVTGDRQLADRLSTQDVVALVAANRVHQLEISDAAAADLTESDVAWGVNKIQAPQVWTDWGVQGAGIVVANIDTGVSFTNTALATNYRGWSAGGVDHNYNWFDASSEAPVVSAFDSHGHGTHTMGVMAGQQIGGAPAIGVAPGVRWIAVRGCAGTFCSDTALLASAQWLLAPTNQAGTNPRPDLRPHVINNSWGKSGNDDWYVGYVEAWNAAGIFSVFANGNSGSFGGCGSTSTPASYANAFAVGATDSNDAVGLFSSRGPTEDGRTKPDLTAPGVAVPSAWPDGTLRSLSGTSMAAPHVAGVAALLWSANPSLIGDIAGTKSLLTDTALPRPTTECGAGFSLVPNNVYGWGRVDARQAVQSARVDVPWLVLPVSVTVPANSEASVPVTLDARQVGQAGSYRARVITVNSNNQRSYDVSFEVLPGAETAPMTGRLTDLWLDQGVSGRVSVGAGPMLQSDYNGYFTATLPYGSYVVTAQATGYFSTSTDASVPGPPLRLVLKADLPHLQVGSPALTAALAFGQHDLIPVQITNAGSKTLTVSASVPALEWVIEDVGRDRTGLYDVSAGQIISLADDMIYPEPLQLGFTVPVYGILVNQLYLSSNGWVSAVRPDSAAPFAACFPEGQLPPGSLAPLWADLDPSQGGIVRAGHVTSSTYVVSFENVPPWRETPDPDGATYTFQLALHANGAIEFVYDQMHGLPSRWSAGAFFSTERSHRLACHRTSIDLSGRTWRLRNQPAPSVWLSTNPQTLIIPPGRSASLEVILSGFGYVTWLERPMQGVVRLATNDPGSPLVELAAQVSVGPAPHSLRLPFVEVPP
jgi:subtilisin family serine protease